jgi:hypothetical protein
VKIFATPDCKAILVFKKQKQRFEKSGRFLDALLENELSDRKRTEIRLD